MLQIAAGGFMIGSLTGLRGLASLWVLAFHIHEMMHLDPSSPLYSVISKGYLGVDLFFALSGFVLSYSNRKESFSSAKEFTVFYFRRAARIFPPHLAALSLVIIAVLFVPAFTELKEPSFYSRQTLIPNALLVQTWLFRLSNWNAPAWSLSVELLGYIIFPVAFIMLRPVGARTSAMLLAIVLASAVGYFSVKGVDDMAKAGATGVLRMAFSFAAGMLAYKMRHLCPKWAVFVAAALLILSLSVDAARPLILIVNVMLLMAISGEHLKLLTRFLTSAPISFLGKISFSLYLVQWATLHTAEALFPLGTLRLVFGIAATVIMALFFYFAVEKPSMILGHLLKKRSSQREMPKE